MRTKLLLIITILAAFLRFHDLGKIPDSLNWDEIAIGYNAYSILKIAKDEYGTFLPLSFRSFDDYKSPLYIYLTVPSLVLFGRSEFAIRLPSALLGSLTIPLIYYLTIALLRPIKPSEHEPAYWLNKIKNIAIIATFLLAITPWHIHFSRVAYEANIGLYFTVLGFILLDRWFQTNRLPVLLLSALSLVAALYSYANMRLLIPLLLFPILVLHLHLLSTRKKQVIITTIFGLIATLPLLVQLYQGQGLARYQATSLASREGIFTQQQQRATQEVQNNRPLIAQTIFNYRLPLAREMLQSYLSHFRFDFLFLQDKPNRYNLAGVGLLYLWYLPLIVVGACAIAHFSQEINARTLFIWLLAAPIPAALTWDTPHAIRVQFLLVPLVMLSATGLWVILKTLQAIDLTNYRQRNLFTWIFPKVGLLSMVGIIIFSITSHWFNYQTHFNQEFAKAWLYGREQMVQKVIELQPQFHTIKVSLSLDWAYLWFLWYGQLDPQQYLNNGGTKGGAFDFSQNKIDNIQFQNFDYTKESQNNTGILFVGTPKDFPPNFIPSFVIENSEGQKFIYIVRS